MSAKTKLTLDIVIFSAMLALTNPRLTGNTIHEWLGISLIAGIITHLLLNWNWIVNVTKTFFKKLFHESRLNYVINLLFFIAMTGTLFSGLMISKDVMSALDIQLNVSGSWKMLHSLLSDASVLILGLHVAMHWKWIVNSISRFIVSPVRSLFQRRPVPQAQTMVTQPVPVKQK
ncbi:MAG: DUF4405 domain-containing protein [Anaerolineales bacterium]